LMDEKTRSVSEIELKGQKLEHYKNAI